MKTCTKCGQFKALADFSAHPQKRDGLQSQCRKCQQDCFAARAKEKRDWLQAVKLDRGCEDSECSGHPEDPVALDFDHVHGEKVASLSSMAGENKPWALLMAEVEKCDVVCANCHRVRTARRAGR